MPPQYSMPDQEDIKLFICEYINDRYVNIIALTSRLVHYMLSDECIFFFLIAN